MLIDLLRIAEAHKTRLVRPHTRAHTLQLRRPPAQRLLHQGLPSSLAHHDSEQEKPDEKPVVVLPHTVRHEGAVVVEPEDALPARVAVLGAGSLREEAVRAT